MLLFFNTKQLNMIWGFEYKKLGMRCSLDTVNAGVGVLIGCLVCLLQKKKVTRRLGEKREELVVWPRHGAERVSKTEHPSALDCLESMLRFLNKITCLFLSELCSGEQDAMNILCQ